MADLMDEAIEISHKLIPCNICGRTFLPSPLKKHAKVCEKNATRKRKTFNSLKQRIEGTELAVFHQKSYLRKNSEANCQSVVGVVATTAAAPVVVTAPSQQNITINEEKKNQSKWKEKHEQLVQAIRAAKGEKVMAPRRSISAVGSMGTTEQCPSCDRHFGPKAYDRHVEWCKEHKIRASKSPAIVTIAKERLEARTKYRVPPLNKSKRSVTREKYASPSGRNSNHHHQQQQQHQHQQQENVVMNARSTSSLEQSSRKTKQKQSQNCPPFTEPVIKQQHTEQKQQQQHHNAEKLKSMNQKDKDDYDPFLIAEKQLMELLQGDDFKPYKTPSPKIKLKSLPFPSTSATSLNNTKKHVRETLQKNKLNSLPDEDNFELIENIINDNEINSIDPKLINEIDGLKIPDQLMIDNYSPTSISYNNNDDVDDYSAQYDKNISLLEPLVLPKTEMKRSSSRLTDADFEEFISSFDDDDGFPILRNFINATDVKPTKKKCLTNSSFGRNAMKCEVNKKHPLSPLKRSVSLSNPVVKARSMKNKQDIQDYLHVREPKQQSKTLANSSPRSSDELFPVGHDMYNEYKKYEEMYRREQDENDEISSNEDSTPPPQHQQQTPASQQHERNYSTAADSAYGSLNRKSPKIQPNSRQSKTQHTKTKRSPSSSGSETCTSLPATAASKKNNCGSRLTKFCHECGTKYPLDSAKFCVECGIKRLVL